MEKHTLHPLFSARQMMCLLELLYIQELDDLTVIFSAQSLDTKMYPENTTQ